MSETLRVRISYSPDKSRVGKIVELPVDEACALIREGRAVQVDDDGPADDLQPADPEPVPADEPATAKPKRR